MVGMESIRWITESSTRVFALAYALLTESYPDSYTDMSDIQADRTRTYRLFIKFSHSDWKSQT